MCGIVGIISRYNNGFDTKESDIFRDMLFVDTLRGVDSTGVFGGNRHNNLYIVKEASNGLDFIQTKEFQDFKSKMVRSGSFAVGHNRAATRGSVSDKNAHPFWVDDKIVLVQNGTMYGDHKKHKDVEVDSEAIAHVLAAEDDIEKALKKIDAAYALVWYNTATRNLHMIRNDARPLHVAADKEGTIYFASEAETITWATGRASKVLAAPPKMLEPFMLQTYHILPDGEHEYSEKKLDCKYTYVNSFPGNQYNGHRHQHPNFRRHGVADAWEFPDSDGPYHQEPDPVGRVNVSKFPVAIHQQPRVVKADDVDMTFSDYIVDKSPESHMSIEDLEDAEKHLNIIKEGPGKYIMLELTDYIPANKHKDCGVFFVMGRLVHPDFDATKPGPVFYFVERKSEHDIMKMVIEQVYFEGTYNHVISRTFINNNNERRGCLMIFTYNLRALPNIKNKVDENHVH